MPVDTRNKRASVLGLGLASLLVLPAPDATVHAVDRPHVAYSYSGLAAEAPVVGPVDLVELTATFRRQVDLQATIGSPVTLSATIHDQVDITVER